MRHLKQDGFRVTSAARVRLNQGGYDRYGSYWGGGEPLYRVSIEGPTPEGERFPADFEVYTRDYDRDSAQARCMARAIQYFQTWGREAPRELHA